MVKLRKKGFNFVLHNCQNYGRCRVSEARNDISKQLPISEDPRPLWDLSHKKRIPFSVTEGVE